MKPILILGVLLFFSSSLTSAQDSVALSYGRLISEDGLRDKLSILAADALEGRETGKRGQKMAAAFIKFYFEELGLAGPLNGSYYQPVTLYTSKTKDIYVGANGQKFKYPDQLVFYGSRATQNEETMPLVFVGQGRQQDFDQIDVAEKGVLIYVNNLDNFRMPIALARQHQAKAIFLFGDDAAGFSELMEQYRNYMSSGVLSLTKPETTERSNVIFLQSDVVPALFDMKIEKLKKAALTESGKKPLAKIKPVNIQYQADLEVNALETENVLGYLEGTDKKDELLVITAHYDHIGISESGQGDRINNGADDDGSGTVSVMELAKAFVEAKRQGKGPRRSILFMLVTGEEKGLLGSDFYTQQPVFPLANTVVNLNIDMVGRRDPEHKGSAPYVYVIGADKLSTELHKLSESVNDATVKLIFDYTYNDENHPQRLYYRSDHWNFAKNNVPIIFYFDGIHEDYHMPSDEVDKIEFDLLKQRAQLVFYTAWEIANREERLQPDQPK